jgi:hypothetical protein
MDLNEEVQVVMNQVAQQHPAVEEYFKSLEIVLKELGLAGNPQVVDAVELPGKKAGPYVAMAVEDLVDVDGKAFHAIINGTAKGERKPDVEFVEEFQTADNQSFEEKLKYELVGYMSQFGEPTDKFF